MPKRTFKAGNDLYDIEENEVGSFLKDMPKAIEIKSFIVDKDTFDIPIAEVNDFIKDMPKAKPLYDEKKNVSSNQSLPNFATTVEDATKFVPTPLKSQSPLVSNLKSVSEKKEKQINPFTASKNQIETTYGKDIDFSKEKPLERTNLYKSAINNIQKRTSDNLLQVEQFRQQGDEDGMRQILAQIQADQQKINTLNKGIQGQKLIAESMGYNSLGERAKRGLDLVLGQALIAPESVDKALSAVESDLYSSIGIDMSKLQEKILKTKSDYEAETGKKMEFADMRLSDDLADIGFKILDKANKEASVGKLGNKYSSTSELIKSGDIGEITKQGVGVFLESLPTSLAMAASPISAATIGAGMVGTEMHEAEQEGQKVDSRVVLSGTIKAALEFATENMFGAGRVTKDLIKSLGKEAAEKAVKESVEKVVKEGFLKKYGKAISEEVLGEVTNQIGSNAVDKYINGKEVKLTDGIDDAAFAAIFSSGIQTTPTLLAQRYVDKKAVAKAQEKKAQAAKLVEEAAAQPTETAQSAIEEQAHKLDLEADKEIDLQTEIATKATDEDLATIDNLDNSIDEITSSIESASSPEIATILEEKLTTLEINRENLIKDIEKREIINEPTAEVQPIAETSNKEETPKENQTTTTPSSSNNNEVSAPSVVEKNVLNENEFSEIQTNVRNEETRKLINAVAKIYGKPFYDGDFTDKYISMLVNMGDLGYEVSELLNAPKKAAKLINEFAKKNKVETNEPTPIDANIPTSNKGTPTTEPTIKEDEGQVEEKTIENKLIPKEVDDILNLLEAEKIAEEPIKEEVVENKEQAEKPIIAKKKPTKEENKPINEQVQEVIATEVKEAVKKAKIAKRKDTSVSKQSKAKNATTTEQNLVKEAEKRLKDWKENAIKTLESAINILVENEGDTFKEAYKGDPNMFQYINFENGVELLESKGFNINSDGRLIIKSPNGQLVLSLGTLQNTLKNIKQIDTNITKEISNANTRINKGGTTAFELGLYEPNTKEDALDEFNSAKETLENAKKGGNKNLIELAKKAVEFYDDQYNNFEANQAYKESELARIAEEKAREEKKNKIANNKIVNRLYSDFDKKLSREYGLYNIEMLYDFLEAKGLLEVNDFTKIEPILLAEKISQSKKTFAEYTREQISLLENNLKTLVEKYGNKKGDGFVQGKTVVEKRNFEQIKKRVYELKAEIDLLNSKEKAIKAALKEAKTESLSKEIIDKLQDLKINYSNRLLGVIPPFNLIPLVWNGSITVLQTSIRAGKAVKEAIQDAVDYVKSKNPTDFNEDAFRKYFNDKLGVKEETTIEEPKAISDLSEKVVKAVEKILENELEANGSLSKSATIRTQKRNTAVKQVKSELDTKEAKAVETVIANYDKIRDILIDKGLIKAIDCKWAR